MNWETVIGLEVHVQLKTQSKLFSGAATLYGAAPNTQTSYIDAGLPGVLPVLNAEAVLMAIKFGLAIDAQLNDLSYFERKNYFYPDLPKGYQISQFQRPIISDGHLNIEFGSGHSKTVQITRAHLEEDAGKSIHDADPTSTGIDLNRAGTPLLEIVTAPCLSSAEEAISYLKTLHQLVRFLGICDGNMQEGSFRCDVNLSLRAKGSQTLGTRTELKNLNSFRFIEKAIAYEQCRHQEILESGQALTQETRLYSPARDLTIPMRGKENEHDYRYFPDPDLLPIHLSRHQIQAIQAQMPRLPSQIKSRLQSEKDLTTQDIEFLLSSPEIFHFYDAIAKQTDASKKIIVNWLKGPYLALLNEKNLSFDHPPISHTQMADLLNRLTKKMISSKTAKLIFSQLFTTEQTIDEIITKAGYDNTETHVDIEPVIQNIMAQHPSQVTEYRGGKDKLLAFFVGQVMKETKGKADPAQVSALLRKYLS